MKALQGVLLLARFRAEGFGWFTATPLAFINSLAPLLAIALVAAIRPLLAGSPRLLVLHVLTSLVALLAPAAVTHVLAQFWRREGNWLRYAVAYNWCQAGITVLTVVLILGFTISGGGRSALGGLVAVVAGVLCYWLGLCWFMLWRGLGISGLQAVVAVIVTNLATGLMILGPQMLAGSGVMMDGTPGE